MRTRTGSIVKRKPRRKGAKATWWARVTYIDSKTEVGRVLGHTRANTTYRYVNADV